MRINLSAPQITAIIDNFMSSEAKVNATDLKEGINILKKAIKSEVVQKNQKIESLIFELSKDGFDDSEGLELVLDKLKLEVSNSGNAKQDKYFDEEGNIKEK